VAGVGGVVCCDGHAPVAHPARRSLPLRSLPPSGLTRTARVSAAAYHPAHAGRDRRCYASARRRQRGPAEAAPFRGRRGHHRTSAPVESVECCGIPWNTQLSCGQPPA